jgi:hypothetical protein
MRGVFLKVGGHLALEGELFFMGYFYRCTDHFEDSPIITHQQCTNYIIYYLKSV